MYVYKELLKFPSNICRVYLALTDNIETKSDIQAITSMNYDFITRTLLELKEKKYIDYSGGTKSKPLTYTLHPKKDIKIELSDEYIDLFESAPLLQLYLALKSQNTISLSELLETIGIMPAQKNTYRYKKYLKELQAQGLIDIEEDIDIKKIKTDIKYSYTVY